MNIHLSDQESELSSAEQFEQSIVNSALWAAAGDALGWITELVGGPTGVRRRIGQNYVEAPVDWQRMIGGRNGPKVNLPAGTYSDDTQLRLAVSRSIRGSGTFDVETFAKIEITVWPTYALGGGRGTKAAALNLSKRGVNWFSNFFESGDQRYVNGGGNGAAMRIQPHVWASKTQSDEMILDVLRDSLVTHGHPHGFCGAVFHAMALADTLTNGSIPNKKNWAGYVERFLELPNIIAKDPQLAAFWRTTWESNTNASLEFALDETRSQALSDIGLIYDLVDQVDDANYHEVLHRLGCLTARFRGSGFKTALASLALAYMYRAGNIQDALICSANELDSDTDTIATMTGALLGAIAPAAPTWPIQDKEYIILEAQRLASIARGGNQDSFGYPDLGRWNPPTNQTASVGQHLDSIAIAGLGLLLPIGPEFPSGDAIWQWFALPFGQTILAKRKKFLKGVLPSSQLPGQRQATKPKPYTPKLTEKLVQPGLPFEETEKDPVVENPEPSSNNKLESPTELIRDPIDMATDEVIHSNFDDHTLGRLLNRCIESSNSVESAIAFVAIIAKAKIARRRRPQK